MNTPTSTKGNLIRYAVYLGLYLAVFGIKALCTLGHQVHMWGVVFFVIITLSALLFYIRRFNREKQRYFEKSFSLAFLEDYYFTLGITALVIVGRIFCAYLQAHGRLPMFAYQTAYLQKDSTPLFWFLICSNGVLLPVLQQFLTVGFFFNYSFRTSNLFVSVAGIIFSGIFFSVLNFQLSLGLFIVNALFGMLFAWSYLYSQTLWFPIYLAILNGIFAIILI